MQARSLHNQDLDAAGRITWAAMLVNAVLIAMKLLGGIYGNSKALIADAVHSISDLASDVMVLIGLHFFRKKEDRDHPYGHGKVETLATLAVGVLLFLAAVRIGIDAALAIHRFDISTPNRYTILIAAFSIAAKELLYQATMRIGKRVGSEAVMANAWHHRSDAWSSVVTLIGVAIASYVPRLSVVDSYAALFVSFFIVKIAFDILRGSIKKIIDTAPSPELVKRMCEEVHAVAGVKNCHDLTGRYYADRIIMEVHVEVEPSLTVLESHGIADKVSKRLRERFEEISKVTVHIDPYEDREPDSGGAS